LIPTRWSHPFRNIHILLTNDNRIFVKPAAAKYLRPVATITSPLAFHVLIDALRNFGVKKRDFIQACPWLDISVPRVSLRIQHSL
jgi:hypothetical protein